jgi:hypothetical protein
METKTAQHTPGPWHLNEKLSRHNTALIYGPDDYLIADAGRIQKRSENETKANAALIAAAPDLLAALKLANEVMNDHFGITDNDEGGNGAHDIIRGAIKKAQP